MKSVSTYLSFDGDCRPAMEFYALCLGGELTTNSYPDASGAPSSDPAARVMHAQVTYRGAPVLMASDTPQPGTLQRGNNFSVAIDCESREEAERLLSGPAAQGEVRMPLTDAPWGAIFGMLTDRFDTPWLINCFVMGG